jgi:hypothetical protein
MTDQEIIANITQALRDVLPKDIVRGKQATKKVKFTRWSVSRDKRNSVAVDPSRVDVVEHFQDAVTDNEKYQIQIAVWWGEDGHDHIPAASRIIMQGRQEYLVNGTVEEVTAALNGADK